jgi:endonuclease/exonuclease/phosphatase family metal-dependent hydrolase
MLTDEPRKKKRTNKRGSMRLMLVVLAASVLGAGNEPYLHAMPSEKKVTVLTRNVDEGTDLDFILAAAAGGTFDDLLAAVTQTYQEVIASGIPERAAAIAREIKDARPDFVGLQEVSVWRTGPGFDPRPAQTVAFDPLESILEELEKLGQHYEVVATVTDFDFELPSTLGIDVRRTDRDVLLVRQGSGVMVFNVHSGDFDTRLPFDSPLLGPIEVPAGWISADAKIRGEKCRVVTTHLDNLSSEVRLGQAFELSQGPLNTELPVVLIGDFNSDAESSEPDQNGAYQFLLGAGLTDAWTAVTPPPGTQGFTWPLHDEDPFTPFSEPTQRIDLVLFRGLEHVSSVELVGDNKSSDLTPSGLWPSDHAGLLATLRLR